MALKVHQARSTSAAPRLPLVMMVATVLTTFAFSDWLMTRRVKPNLPQAAFLSFNLVGLIVLALLGIVPIAGSVSVGLARGIAE